jgi:hypothetical protein
MALLTELRQTCCHPQIVREGFLRQRTRLSMTSIMARLATTTFVEYDAAVRALVREEALLAAVNLQKDGGESRCPTPLPTKYSTLLCCPQFDKLATRPLRVEHISGT